MFPAFKPSTTFSTPSTTVGGWSKLRIKQNSAQLLWVGGWSRLRIKQNSAQLPVGAELGNILVIPESEDDLNLLEMKDHLNFSKYGSQT